MSDAGESVRLADWPASRTPPPPPALAARITASVGDVTCSRAALPGKLVEHALHFLKSIGDARESADDLLTADALITYAMEATTENCQHLDALAADAAKRIASLEQSDGAG